jgi:small subunit ribosomal protein S17
MPKRRFRGKVVSDKMEKTIVVAVERVSPHPIYRKQVRRTARFKAHDDSGAKVGDEVVIEETKPFSKEKRWRVVEVAGRSVGDRGGEERGGKRGAAK